MFSKTKFFLQSKMHCSVRILKDTCCLYMISKTESLIWYTQLCHNIIGDDKGSFFISKDQLWEGPAKGGMLRWLISPILDMQILGHQGHRKVGPVGSCSCASFRHLLLSSAASRLVISKSCAALLVVNHHAAWFSASCSQCLGLMPAWVNWLFS